MYGPTFALAAFRGQVDWQLSGEIMTLLLDLLTEIDCVWLRANPSLPRLYQGGVRYYAEDEWEGPWLDLVVLNLVGFGDCKSLAAARCAELRVRDGIDARCEFSRTLYSDGTQQIHVIVRLPDGRFEDPSLILGMKAA